MPKILLIEDDLDMVDTIRDYLEFQNYRVESANHGEASLAYLSAYTYDLIVLDVELPGMDGFEICTRFRSMGGTAPIIMVTGRGESIDKCTGFRAGTDDYMIKPVNLEELGLRIKALLRRSYPDTGSHLRIHYLELELDSMRAWKEKEEIKLTGLEFALLEYLMRHPGKVHSPEHLINAVWTSDTLRDPSTVRTIIKKIRDKIDRPGHPSLITSVHGAGYRLEP